MAARLKADGRLVDKRIAQPHPVLVSVRTGRSTVLLAPAAAWDRAREVFAPYAPDLGSGAAVLVLVGVPSRPGLDAAMNRGLCAAVSAEPTSDELFVAIHNALELLETRTRAESRGRWLNRYRYELGELIEIAKALTTERDIDKLLALILEKSRFISGADAGSIYVVEGDDPDIVRRTLHFKLSQNDSMQFDSSEFSMPISPRSIAGYAALHRRTINIRDVYALPPDASYSHGKSYDETTGYRTKSMLCMPLLSNQGDVIGVIQLINKKRTPEAKLIAPEDFAEHVVPFDQRSEDLLSTLASQAGIALENAILYAENQRMLEGFVRASVEAIEQRDPTTSGHSRRVADLTVALAKAVERTETGPYRDVAWRADELRELEYASLLHDFGKIGVREQVLVKAKKLYPYELEQVRMRFGLAVRSAQVAVLKRQLHALLSGADPSELADLDEEFERRRQELEQSFAAVAEANEPRVLSGGDMKRIELIAQDTFVDHAGERLPLLQQHDLLSLSIPRGSLTPDEMQQIRSHVVHTVEFLSRIPWGRQFRRVAHIAGAHHERLDGTGYPKRLRSSEIPLQAKMMSVSDIFDALTAADRPYKKAVPLTVALDILNMEVKQGHIDEELVRMFIDAKPWEQLPDPPQG